MRTIVLIAHNLRSVHNVGSLLRTAEGIGVTKVYLTGYTPYPLEKNDKRLPHLSAKLNSQISKTALGAEKTIDWEHFDSVLPVIKELLSAGFTVAALEQATNSITLADFRPPDKLALIVGREVEGIEPEVIQQASVVLEIPMFGQKESFNVVQAAAMALYRLRFLAE